MSNVPKLRFKEFSGEWEEKKLGDIFDFYSTNSYSRSCLNNDKGRVRNIHYGDIHMRFPTMLDVKNIDIPYINDEIDLNTISKDCYCKEGDIVIADASEDYEDIGKTVELKNVGSEKIVAGLHTLLGRDNKGITKNGYRGYMFLSNRVRKQIKVLAVGAKVLGISKTNINKVLLNVPVDKEQQKIGQFFYTIDKKIERQQEKVALLEQYKKCMMQKIFSQEIRFKDENGEEYPEWEEKRLGEIVILMQSGISRRLSEKDIGVPVIRSNNLIDEKIDKTDIKYWYEIDNKGANLENYFLKKGDLLINFINSLAQIGKSAVYNDELKRKCIFTTNIMRLNFNDNIDTKYIFRYFQLNKYKNYIKSIAKPAVNQASFTTVDFKKFKIDIPVLKEQKKIANFFYLIDEKLNKEKEKLDLLKECKKGLLQQMFV
ncbi:restriction endonuclease subunit S [Clostridium botulinum]|uniref:restriction endonuclease subunit S n=1 Tax=Clostridium botulinum TaxID=1491 RepID=UPI000947569D|nr:restriction endonuclease subunit S [Clostridium botulinum]APQ78442.1 type I restriction modification DNA specificity domain protein [Clostridium botulinum]MBN3353803.1 restriction endonuclease subunit S [Clostridium botulinum]QDY29209.1 restriction endonuclease subunit S [Clostridium botulinum]